MPTVKLNGSDYHYAVAGDASAATVLCLHSLFFDARMFEPQLRELANDYRVIALDQRGHGGTPHPADGDYSMDRLAEDAADLISALDLGPVHVVGNSMGGFVALRLAARRPDLVRSATAIGSSAEAEYRTEEYRPLVQLLKAEGGAGAVDALMYTMFGDTTLSAPSRAEIRDTWRTRLAALPPTIGQAAEAVVERAAVVDELAQAAPPILAIAGAEDHAYSVENSEIIARRSRSGRCVVVESAGHSACLEAPAAVNAHLREHFSAAEAQSGTELRQSGIVT